MYCSSGWSRTYEIQPDRLRIVLGWRPGVNVPFDTVERVSAGRGIDALAFWGMRFAPSVKTPVRIHRTKGWEVVISPEDREAFIEKLEMALADYRNPPQPDIKD